MRRLFILAFILFTLTACGGSHIAPVSPQPLSPSESSEPPAAPDSKSGAWKPDGPVTVIVAYKAGSGTDKTARVLAEYAEKYIGQPIVIENVRPVR